MPCPQQVQLILVHLLLPRWLLLLLVVVLISQKEMVSKVTGLPMLLRDKQEGQERSEAELESELDYLSHPMSPRKTISFLGVRDMPETSTLMIPPISFLSSYFLGTSHGPCTVPGADCPHRAWPWPQIGSISIYKSILGPSYSGWPLGIQARVGFGKGSTGHPPDHQ